MPLRSQRLTIDLLTAARRPLVSSTRLRSARTVLSLLISACVGLKLALAQSQASRVTVPVLYCAKGSYTDAAAALADALRKSGHNPQLIALDESDLAARRATLDRLRADRPSVVATAGPSLTLEALEAIPAVPVVYFMVPNARDAPFVSKDFPHRERVAGVTSDVAPPDQLAWVRRVCPNCTTMAVLTSERCTATAADLAAAGRQVGLEIVPIAAKLEKFADVFEQLGHRQLGVLMLPDAQVYNAANVQGLLVWGIRNKRAIWGFSDKIVKAGAFAGIYSDPAAVGRDAAEIVDRIAGGTSPSQIGLRYPRSSRRGVNLHTAEMIGASIEHLARDSDVERFGDQQ